MHVNNLGARMPVTTTADRSAQTARTSFSTLVQGATSVPTTSQAGVPGSSIVATAISASSGGIPGSGFGAPYLQAMPTGVPVTGNSGALPVHTQAPGAEFNGELHAMQDQQMMLALQELMKMSLRSFMQATFTMGQQRPQPEPS